MCPAGADYVTEYDGPVDGIILQISAECLALAGARLAQHGGQLIEQMDGRDGELCRMAREMEAEGAAGHPNGVLFWSSAVDDLLRRMVERHYSAPAAPLRGAIDARGLRRVEAFIQDHLAAPIDLAALAAVAGCDRFHFAHRFRAAVGVSPYRYVVRRRLEQARTLLLAGRQSIADVAAATGFSDQSHLTSWMRRVYGTTPKRFLSKG
ncbi:hypothetical protein BRAS3843_1340026 [Bradyrhizobium sp. STM 3843]|nr:hypothetical protein BRAS3843_1340026 [Bradyrhizobium sp. STM 3843]